LQKISLLIGHEKYESPRLQNTIIVRVVIVSGIVDDTLVETFVLVCVCVRVYLKILTANNFLTEKKTLKTFLKYCTKNRNKQKTKTLKK
jgi:hypothetical protein